MTIIKYYLVDSENVNDNWLMLLDIADPEDEIIVFYTKSSPHMSYTSVIKLIQINRKIKFELCYEGSNALDFQLISYLGYLMKNGETGGSEFIIMSNDNGFEPAVRFWQDKGFPVKKFNVNFCKSLLRRQEIELSFKTAETPDVKNQTGSPVQKQDNISVDKPEVISAPKQEPDSTIKSDKTFVPKQESGSEKAFVPEQKPQASAEITASKKKVLKEDTGNTTLKETTVPAATQETKETGKKANKSKKPSLPETEYSFNKPEVDTIINCLGENNLIGIHETLVHVYGQEQGQNIYKTVKEKAYPLDKQSYQRKDKVKNFSDIVFSKSDLNDPGDFVDFLESNKDKCKNLNGVRSTIIKRYGGANGIKYYSLFKPYFKTISAFN